MKIQFFVQRTSITSLLLAVRTSTVTTVSKKVTMITSSYYLLLSPLRWKALYFWLSRIIIRDLNILHLQIIFACLPPVKPRDIASISSILMGVQRWQVSWIKSTCCQYSVGWVGWGWWAAAARMGVGPFAKKKTSMESVGILGSLWQGKPGIVTQVTNHNTTFLRSRHCLVIFIVFILLF